MWYAGVANGDAHFDIHQLAELGFPQSLPDFQRLFPDEAACAAYLELLRWPDGFACAARQLA